MDRIDRSPRAEGLDAADAPGSTPDALRLPYLLQHELGRGGMATVHLARDRKHDRDVAVKVLHADLSHVLGAERFLQEIRVTAHLQHPHLLALLDSGVFGEEAGELRGLPFYVMPYVAGRSLRARLAREGPLPVTDALRITREIAGALDYAHRHGIVHRDVKPENVFLDEDGQALVADFGIALAVEQAGGTRLTQAGVSLGTPQYMAPEQALGERVIDARADVYALGCVLYEMLSGEPPFTGPTAQAVVARVLTEAPRSLVAQRPNVPPHVDAAVRTALEKLPADRFPSAAALAQALDGPREGAHEGAHEGARTTARRRAVRLAWPALVGGALLAGAALGWAARSPSTAGGEPVRFTIEPDSLTPRPSPPAISPDGRTVVFAAEGPQGVRLYARRADDLAMRPIAGTENGDVPFFSPDGAWIGFFDGTALRKVPLAGGSAALVATVSGPVSDAAWGPDGIIVYNTAPVPTISRAYRVPASGGVPEHVRAVDPAGSIYSTLYHARPLPGGRALLVTRSQGGSGVLNVMGTLELQTGRFRAFGRGEDPHYATGYLVYADASGHLYRRRFDIDRLEPVGPKEEIAREAIVFDVSPSGAIVYRAGAPATAASGHMVLVDRTGRVLQDFPVRAAWTPRFSPDGRRIAYGAFGAGQTSSDIWVTDLVDGTTQRLTADSADNNDPQWSPDGQSLVYSAVRPGTGKDLLVQALGGGPVRQLTRRRGAEYPNDWSPDGRTVPFTMAAEGAPNNSDIWLQPVDGSPPHPYLATPASEAGLRVSPDGRWAAYTSDETGRREVYVQAYPTPGHKALISSAGGINPVWGRDGRTLHYWQPDPQAPQNTLAFQLVAAAVGTDRRAGGPLVVRGRTPLLRASYLGINDNPLYDVAPDGSRFVVVTAPAQVNRFVVALHALDGGDRRR